MASEPKPSEPDPPVILSDAKDLGKPVIPSEAVILSETKDLSATRRFFAALRMTTGAGLLIAAVVLVAIAVGGFAVWRIDWLGEHGSGLSDSFKYDLQKYQKIDPARFIITCWPKSPSTCAIPVPSPSAPATKSW